jgi:glycosyltransferase involved in cell wall biosynthesis
MTGYVDHEEVPAELNNLRLLVMSPEPTEGLPTVILKTMARGTPAYATPVSEVPDIVRAGETGFLMKHREPDRIVADIEAILEPEDLTAVSQRARDLAVSEYSFEAAVDRYQRLLGDLQAQERH